MNDHPPGSAWSLEQDQILYDCYYGDETARQASVRIGRTRNACIGRARRLMFHREDPFMPRKRKPPPPPPELPRPFVAPGDLTPAKFPTQCQHMTDLRCNFTVQPGSLLCATHQTQRHLEEVAR